MIAFIVKVSLVLVLLSATYIICGIIHRYRQRSLSFLRGPAKTSILLGAEYDLLHQEETGVLEEKWLSEYGTAFRASTYYSEDMLVVAVSPSRCLSLASIAMVKRKVNYAGSKGLAICDCNFGESSYRFPKPQDVRQITTFLMGRGILNVEGAIHNRHRKALNPAFSAKQLRQFLGLFQRSTGRLVAKWQQEIDNPANERSVLNVTAWLPKITLDVIGESAFNYKFGSLDGEETELGTIFENLFVESRLYPRKRQLLYRALRRNLPASVADFLLQFPTKEEKRFLGFLNASKRVARPLFERASNEKNTENDVQDDDHKDVLSVLVRANQEEDPRKALNEDEVLSQMATMILAGHETTASTMTWILYALTKSPKDQERIYQEIREMRELTGNQEPTPQDLDSMNFFNAVIKEGLRLYPIVPNITREAQSDDVIPLEFPVTTVSGDEIFQIPVSKGQRVMLCLGMYNRLVQVWGDDADQWNPERFIKPSKKNTTLGVYANLMTFSAGLRACIGWRFAVMELQAIMFGLLEKFEFCPPASGELDEIQAVPFGLIIPMKRGKWKEGKQMPLHVKTRK
ncbi:cytochrome P450 [Lentinula aff. detonsa]|uniref:Cytochrome P450 n=1 Tax=Lentinula aff. detonsa TaxID=2804958 RepID=A0AA38KAF5_9AGAR|nr:cytochrome P450 [Lentinula aff. detonsa]